MTSVRLKTAPQVHVRWGSGMAVLYTIIQEIRLLGMVRLLRTVMDRNCPICFGVGWVCEKQSR